jgi:prepilin signal peptidase PulO-like enzyme (type II secretory pathway)
LSFLAYIPPRHFIVCQTGENPPFYIYGSVTALCSIAIITTAGQVNYALSGHLFFLLFMSQLCFLDNTKNWLPLGFTLSFIAAGFLYQWGGGHVPEALFGATTGGGVFYAFQRLTENNQAQLGFGDKYLVAGVGMWLGIQPMLHIVTLSLMLLTGLAVRQKLKKQDHHNLPLTPTMFIVSNLYLIFH